MNNKIPLHYNCNNLLPTFLIHHQPNNTRAFITSCLPAAFSAFYLHAKKKKVFWRSASMSISLKAAKKKAQKSLLLDHAKCLKLNRCTPLDRVMFFVCALPQSLLPRWNYTVMTAGCILEKCCVTDVLGLCLLIITMMQAADVVFISHVRPLVLPFFHAFCLSEAQEVSCRVVTESE